MKKDWGKGFDKGFARDLLKFSGKWLSVDELKLIKHYIRETISQELKSQQADIKKMIEGMKIPNPRCYCKTHPEHNCGITSNEAVSDILKELEK